MIKFTKLIMLLGLITAASATEIKNTDNNLKLGFTNAYLLNIRLTPSLDSKVKKVYKFGKRVSYKNINNEWSILDNGYYAKSKYISDQKNITITTNALANIRLSKDTSKDPVYTVNKGTELNAIGYFDDWYILPGGKIISNVYVSKPKEAKKEMIKKKDDLQILENAIVELINKDKEKDKRIKRLEKEIRMLKEIVKEGAINE